MKPLAPVTRIRTHTPPERVEYPGTRQPSHPRPVVIAPRSGRRRLDSLDGGTVAERTIAPALKAGGRKARGFDSLPFRWLEFRRERWLAGGSPGPGRDQGAS